MGRPIPSSQAISLPLSLPLFAASIVASVAIFITLCISHQRKSSRSPKSQPSSPKRQPTSSSLHSSSTSDKSTKKIKKTSTESMVTPTDPPRPIEDQEHSRQSPPLVPDETTIHEAIGPISPVNASTSSRRRLSASLSMRLTGGLSKIRTSNKKKVEEAEETPAEEQSVWMKTIILGERCKVPSDDEEVVMKDEKGNKKRNYHPKTPRSLPVSRTNSFVTVNAE